MIITDLTTLPPDYEPPNIEDLKEIIRETIEESQSIRREAKRRYDDRTTSFICLAIEDLEWMLQFYAANSTIFLNELAISRRKHLEIYIDLMWVYKIYLEDEKIAEELCKRFYQVGAKDFIELQSSFKYNKNDLFLGDKEIYDEHLENLEKAKDIEYIKLDPTEGEHEKSHLFEDEWRAHPKLYEKSSDMRDAIYRTRDRIKMLNDFFKNHFNIQNPPFLKDYDRLNKITHWTTFRIRTMSQSNMETLHLRELNLMLGYHHDTLNLIFEYLNKDIPNSVAIIRQKFPWLS